MTGINASKIIQNLQFVNSFGPSSLAFFCFGFFILQTGSGAYPYHPPWAEGAVVRDFLRLLNMGPRLRTGSLCLQVWSMAPLPLCNEYRFPQLGPHWMGNSIAGASNPRERAAGRQLGNSN